MRRRRIPEYFMSDRYDKKLKRAFESLYEGNREEYASICSRILEVFEDVMKKGCLTSDTFQKLQLLEAEAGIKDSVIISVDSEEITLLNRWNQTFDQFLLTDYISYIVCLLARDPFFRKEMCGHYDYDGMMKALEKVYSMKENTQENTQEKIVACRDDGVWICSESGVERKIGEADNTILNLGETEGISWITVTGNRLSFSWYDGEEILPARLLKTALVWGYFLNTAYDYRLRLDGGISDLLWADKISRTPIPFNAANMKECIRLVEERIPDGIVSRGENYACILTPVLTEQDLSRDLTDDLFETYGIGREELDHVRIMESEEMSLLFP